MQAPHPSNPELTRVVRGLQLPLHPELEDEAPAAVAAALIEAGVPASEHVAALEADIETWEDFGECPSRLAKAIGHIVARCSGGIGATLSEGYAKVHKALTVQGELDVRAARHLLSNARLISHLLTSERASCAQTARLLSAQYRGSTYTWQQIQQLCKPLGIDQPAVSREQCEQIFESDSLEQVIRFADSTEALELEQLTQHAIELGFQGNHKAVLRRFTRPGFTPAMRVIAHYMLTVCEFYDHPPSIPYEFAPRGNACEYLQDQHPTYRRGAAILNVAKASPSLDDTWAWGRRGADRRGDALALSALFRGLEQMPYTARRELATWLRQWIVRTYERAIPARRLLNSVATESEAATAIKELVEQETHTAGTVEQRVVDALTAVLHPGGPWRPRGRGDSVYAANLFRKKMGDCEYLKDDAAVIVAYEAHAGLLNDSYVQSHRRSLEKVIQLRNEDLEARADPIAWEIRVRFVVYETRLPPLCEQHNVGEYRVSIDEVTYGDLLEDALDAPGFTLAESLNQHLIEALNSTSVPQSFRDRVAEICTIGQREESLGAE